MLHSIPNKSYSEHVYSVLSEFFGGVNDAQSGFCACTNNPPIIYWGEVTRDGYQLTLAQCSSTFNVLELETAFVFQVEPYYRKAQLVCAYIDGEYIGAPGIDIQIVVIECLKKWNSIGYKMLADSTSTSVAGLELILN